MSDTEIKAEYDLMNPDTGEVESMDWVESTTIGAEISEDMQRAGALIAWAGSLHGQAKADLIQAEAELKNWKAKTGQALLDADPKLAEWKVKQAIEANPRFLKLSALVSEAAKREAQMQWTCRAMITKADTLRTIGANLRAEYRTTNLRTKADREAGVKSALSKD